MKSRIVKIGNSRGIRIPKPLIDQTGLDGEVTIIARNGALVITRSEKPRAGWDEAFAKMAKRGDDVLLDGDALPPTRFDTEEWEWK